MMFAYHILFAYMVGMEELRACRAGDRKEEDGKSKMNNNVDVDAE